MARYKAQIVTPWVSHDDTGPDGNGTNHPLIQDEYDIIRLSDITGQDANNLTPAPNQFTVECVLEGEVLDTIEDDPDYVVLNSEEFIEPTPPA